MLEWVVVEVIMCAFAGFVNCVLGISPRENNRLFGLGKAEKFVRFLDT